MFFFGGFVDVKWGVDEECECCFVFIGKNLDKDVFINGFMDCKCFLKFCFKVGDAVFAQVGVVDNDGYCCGIVCKMWDLGNLYQIEFEDGKKIKVWGFVDEDEFVKVLFSVIA